MDKVVAPLQRQLALITGISFALTPVLGYAVAHFYGMVDVIALFHGNIGYTLLAGYALLVLWVITHFYQFLAPIIKWHTQHPYGSPLPDRLNRQLTTFGSTYWSFFLVYVLTLPTIQYWAVFITPPTGLAMSLINFMLLQLVMSALVGMPGYMLALTRLGQLNRYIGIPTIQVSMKTKMLLIGAYLPILTTAVLMKYYWWRTGFLTNEIVLAWSAFALLSILITSLAIHSLKLALIPVQSVISGSGASTHQQLARQMRPHSMDEIGYLVQMLGRVFKRLADQESHVSAIVDHAAEGIIVLNEDQTIDTFNPAAETLFGFKSHEIRGKHLRWLMPTVDVRAYSESGSVAECELFGRHSNGTSIALSLRVSRMYREEQLFYTLLVADISARKASEYLLLEAESRYRTLVETAHDLLWSMNNKCEFTYLNNAATSIYGYTPEEMLHRHYSEFAPAGSKNRDDAAFARLLAGKELIQYETTHLDKQGNERYLSFNARPLANEDGKVFSISGTARDITDKKKFERELTYQAQHDALTGLYNRAYFQKELERVISRVVRSGSECALLYLDLDQFKYVNDTLGHAAGDRLLIECTELLTKNVREGDLVARFGGDEFTVLLYNIERAHVLPALENIRKLFERYSFLEGRQTFNVTSSIGSTIIDNQTESAEAALAQADLACNIAKSQGRNRVHLYKHEDSEQSGMAEDIGWIARVRDAIDNDRFELLYQPILHLASAHVHGYEVLLRLPTTDGKSIMPGGFIPVAERFGLIHSIDRWAVTRAMQYLAELHNANLNTRFAVNLSGRAFDDPELLDIIHGILRETNLNPATLTFEITETAAIANLKAARKFIGKLKDMGCTLALDDFGTGFCSFTYLKHLPVDILKIDGSFIQGIAQSKVDEAMVISMNQIAHALGKTTIAEFVEDHKTLQILKDIGVDYAQGHYLGKPRRDLLINLEQQFHSITQPQSA